jgi:hypothetical protein
MGGEKGMSFKSATKYKIKRGGKIGDNDFTEMFSAVALELRTLPDDKMKRSRLLSILRSQMKPVLSAVKQKTPVADKTVKFRGKEYPPQNLKKSMAIKTSPMKNYPNVLVGPRMGIKAKHDGFYTFWIQYGTVHQAPNDFIDKAASPLLAAREAAIAKVIEPYIYKESKKLKL